MKKVPQQIFTPSIDHLTELKRITGFVHRFYPKRIDSLTQLRDGYLH